ncbi:TRI15 protein, partial [Urocolius indicus]|nr:TRI15 protein [Urocolius indicus]
LQKQEAVLLAQLDQACEELTRERRDYVRSVTERQSLLDTLIAQIQKKREQPVVEFLMSSSPCCLPLSCEAAKAPVPEPVSPELQRTVQNLSEVTQLVVGAVDKFKGKAKGDAVTLDPATASPDLALSKDRRTLRLADGQQNLPDTPKRFTGSPSVLGSQG